MSDFTRLAVICALISGSILNARADDLPQPTEKKAESGRIAMLSFWIKNKNSGKYLAVTAKRTDNGAPVVQSLETGPASLWGLVDAGAGYHKIVNRHSGKELSIWNSSKNPGALVEQHEFENHTRDYHQWKFVGDGQGFFRLVNRGSGMSLGVLGSSMEENQPAVQWPANDSSDQMWQLIVVAMDQDTASIPLLPEADSELPKLPPISVPPDPFSQPTTKSPSPKKDSVAKPPKPE